MQLCRLCGMPLSTEVEINFQECSGCGWDEDPIENVLARASAMFLDKDPNEQYYGEGDAGRGNRMTTGEHLRKKSVEIASGPFGDDLMEICHAGWEV